MFNWILFAILIGLQAADVATTSRNLKAGGRELNPVSRFFMDKFGILPGLLLSKAPLMIGAGVATYLFQSLWYWPVGLGVVCIIYVLVVCHNYGVMKATT